MQRVHDFRASAPASSGKLSAVVLQTGAPRLSHEWRVAHHDADNPPSPLRGYGEAGVVAYGIGVDAPAEWLDADGAWCARIVNDFLGARERVIWATSRKPEARRREWLLGRVAAKEAVSEHLRRRHGVHIAPFNFEILPDPDGRPIVTGIDVTGINNVTGVPVVSISHADGAAIAIAGDGHALEGIGIDLERRGRMTLRMESLVFTAAERALLEAFEGPAREEWGARLWSAKEAVAKFTACAIVPTSRALQVVHIDGSAGIVLLQHRNECDAVVTFRAATAQHGPWILATCLQRVAVASPFEMPYDGVSRRGGRAGTPES
jgi:phosphopantetheinyl transferase (holo-ACP synthase)